ncbi:MAG: phosphodiesterase [Erysipelotrichaceae bacterium]|nr:phosphodiesterase [Erysipelotrichaceae bacterium]
MKYLIASDIHGSAHYTQIILEQFEKMNCDKLILLGDILYHGPRNPVPYGHDPKKVFEMLNNYADRIICLKGNCDADIDQMVLEFPILAPYFIMEANGKLIYFTHGDIFNSSNLPARDIILVHGHTHVQRCEQHEDHVYLNPGSISVPKPDNYHGFMVLENGCFSWYDETGVLKNQYRI